MSRKRRIAILAPQGWSLRDWLNADFLAALRPVADITFFSPLAESLAREFRIEGVDFEFMRSQRLGKRSSLVWAALRYGRHYQQPTNIHRSMLRFDRASTLKGRLQQGVLRAAGRGVLQHLSHRSVGRIERAFLGFRDESARLEEVFRARGIDLVMATSPLASYFERPALWAAQRLGLPTVAFITSWDNLYGKGTLPIEFSHYLVWSEHMQAELQRQYPRIPSSAISPVGVPRFDYYSQPQIRDRREDFIRSIGGDPARPIILWSAVSANLMPEEPAFLARFCDAIRAGRIPGRPQVLLRPHPIGGGRHFAAFRRAYPEVLFTETNDEDPQLLVEWLPLQKDMNTLVNSIAHACLNVNVCSTMTLDCCVLDLPVVNIAFDLVHGSQAEGFIKSFYTFEHYQPVTEMNAVRLAHDFEQLFDHVGAYLQDPALDRANRARLLRLWCGQVDGGSAGRAGRVVAGLLGGRSAAGINHA